MFTKQGLIFRPVEPSDLEMLMHHRNANLAGLRTPIPVMGMSEQTMWYDSLHAENMAFIAITTEVRSKERIEQFEGDVVGMLRISNIEWPQRSAGVTGIDVFAGHTGNGYGTRILRGGIEWLMQDLGFHRVTGEALDTSLAAQKIILNAGMKLDGCKRSYIFRDGAWHDFRQYSILEGEL